MQTRQPAAFIQGSKEDAADAVATYTAAMKARSAAAAVGRTSPLRPKVSVRFRPWFSLHGGSLGYLLWQCRQFLRLFTEAHGLLLTEVVHLFK